MIPPGYNVFMLSSCIRYDQVHPRPVLEICRLKTASWQHLSLIKYSFSNSDLNVPPDHVDSCTGPCYFQAVLPGKGLGGDDDEDRNM